jgi:hypothetical protein
MAKVSKLYHKVSDDKARREREMMANGRKREFIPIYFVDLGA